MYASNWRRMKVTRPPAVLKGTWPVAGVATVGAGSIGMSAAPTGKYATVDLSDALGGIQITFNGPQVNATISGKKLGLNAALSTNADIIWVCGTAGAAGAGGPAESRMGHSPNFRDTPRPAWTIPR